MTTASRRKAGEGAEREMTLKAAAEMTGLPGKLLRRYIRDGRLRPASVDGSKLTVTLAALRDAGLVSSSALPLARGPEPTEGADEGEAEGESEPQDAGREEGERAERERAENERAERERAEKERAEKERAEKERAEKERAAAETAERERRERERAERERAERARSERGARDRARGEKEGGGRDARERDAREKAEREARERAEREKAERETREKAEREAREAAQRAKPGGSAATPRLAEAMDALDADDEETIAARPQAVTDDDRELADEDDAVETTETVRLQPDQAAPPVEGRVVGEPAPERSLVVSGGPWVTSAQMNDLLRHIIADREARSSEYLERTEALYREIVESQKTRIGILESEAKALQAKLEDSLRLVPKGENLQALEQTIRDLRIEVDRREAARVDLEHERDRLRDLTDRLRNDLSRAEKRNLEMAEQLRRFRAQGPLDRLLGREPDDR